MDTTDASALDGADMQRLAGGHDAALNDLMARHARPVFHFLCRMLGNEDDANDLAQETFVRVYQHRASFKAGRQIYHLALYNRRQPRPQSSPLGRRHPSVSLDAESETTGQSIGDVLPSSESVSRRRRRSRGTRGGCPRGGGQPARRYAGSHHPLRMGGPLRRRSCRHPRHHPQGHRQPPLPRPQPAPRPPHKIAKRAKHPWPDNCLEKPKSVAMLGKAMTNCLITGTFSRWRGVPLVSFVWLMVFGLAMAAAAAERQQLHGRYVPAAVARLAPVGDLPGSQRLNLAIGLPLRNQPELDSLLQQIYDPASPNYRHYLTTEQFTERFGPTEQDYQALMDFAKANGLTVTLTHPNRVVLDVAGSGQRHCESLPADAAGLPASDRSAHLLRARHGTVVGFGGAYFADQRVGQLHSAVSEADPPYRRSNTTIGCDRPWRLGAGR